MNTTFSEKFGWEIERHPVSFEREGTLVTDPNFQIISRNDNDKVLSVMSKKYCPMTVGDFEKTTERMQEMSGMEFQGYQEFNDGKILLSILKNNLYKVIILLRSQNEMLEKDKLYLADALADISHQLKTPLTSMMVMSDLLRDNTVPEKQTRF